jgi:hypothetical protein
MPGAISGEHDLRGRALEHALPAAAWYSPFICIWFLRSTSAKTKYQNKEKYRCENRMWGTT